MPDALLAEFLAAAWHPAYLKALLAVALLLLVLQRARPPLPHLLRNVIIFAVVCAVLMLAAGTGAILGHDEATKVLDALEDALALPRGGLEDSRAVLRDYGNMSAVTVLFVAERMDVRRKKQSTLLTALGPGFSAAFLMLDGQALEAA